MHTPITLTVNATQHIVAVDPARTLLSVLRDELGLTGAKYGCGDGKCGACTVHLDGKPVQACSLASRTLPVGASPPSKGWPRQIASTPCKPRF